MTPFTRTIHEGKYSVSATYKVHGFWSGDTVQAGICSVDGIKWAKPYINWSDEDYDPKEEPDFITAASNFAAALNDAVALAREWKTKYTDQTT